MKKIVSTLVIALAFIVNVNAQDSMTDTGVKTISLEQTQGEFTQ